MFSNGHYMIWQAVNVITKNRGHKLDPCGKRKKTKENKIRRCNSYTPFIFFLG